jgi:hypothetical protein
MSGLGIGYRHTQYGWWLIIMILGFAAFVPIYGLPLTGSFLILAAVLLVLGWLFHSLTIEIAEGELRWRFGPGLVRKSVPLAEIASVRAVRTNILEGWGIHWSRFGWLYNVSGLSAVAITLRSGKRFALGTDEPQELSAQLFIHGVGPAPT